MSTSRRLWTKVVLVRDKETTRGPEGNATLENPLSHKTFQVEWEAFQPVGHFRAPVLDKCI